MIRSLSELPKELADMVSTIIESYEDVIVCHAEDGPYTDSWVVNFIPNDARSSKIWLLYSALAIYISSPSGLLLSTAEDDVGDFNEAEWSVNVVRAVAEFGQAEVRYKAQRGLVGPRERALILGPSLSIQTLELDSRLFVLRVWAPWRRENKVNDGSDLA